jgi:hypothetical protein
VTHGENEIWGSLEDAFLALPCLAVTVEVEVEVEVEVLRYRHLLLTEDSITSEHGSAYPRLTIQPIRVANNE